MTSDPARLLGGAAHPARPEGDPPGGAGIPAPGELVELVIRKRNGVAHRPWCKWLPEPVRLGRLDGSAYRAAEYVWPAALRLCPTCFPRQT